MSGKEGPVVRISAEVVCAQTELRLLLVARRRRDLKPQADEAAVPGRLADRALACEAVHHLQQRHRSERLAVFVEDDPDVAQ
jgi:hypothetical protein